MPVGAGFQQWVLRWGPVWCPHIFKVYTSCVNRGTLLGSCTGKYCYSLRTLLRQQRQHKNPHACPALFVDPLEQGDCQ